ncbi:MAG: hypothetical protein M1812_006193 [Candelaria pacifica]|nr:MAG: hypothetical protein M1812_006193 [Candelaria pacifica]
MKTGSTTVGERDSCGNEPNVLAEGCVALYADRAIHGRDAPSNDKQTSYGEKAFQYHSGNSLDKEYANCRQSYDEGSINDHEPVKQELSPYESGSQGAFLQLSDSTWRLQCGPTVHGDGENPPSSHFLSKSPSTTEASTLGTREPDSMLKAPHVPALVPDQAQSGPENLYNGTLSVTRSSVPLGPAFHGASSATVLRHSQSSRYSCPPNHSSRSMSSRGPRRNQSLPPPDLSSTLDCCRREEGGNEAALRENIACDRPDHSSITRTPPNSSPYDSGKVILTVQAGASANTSPLSSPPSSPLGESLLDLESRAWSKGVRQSTIEGGLWDHEDKGRHHVNHGEGNAPLECSRAEEIFVRRSSRPQRHRIPSPSTPIHSSALSERSQQIKCRGILKHDVNTATQSSNGQGKGKISCNYLRSPETASYLITPQSRTKTKNTGTQFVHSSPYLFSALFISS